MKMAIVSASALMAEKRWDSSFHITLSELRGRVEELKMLYTPEEATAKVDALPLSEKSGLSVLVRGGSYPRALDTAQTRIVSKEYPYLALAIVERDVDTGIARLRDIIAQNEKALQDLLAIAAGRPTPPSTEDH